MTGNEDFNFDSAEFDEMAKKVELDMTMKAVTDLVEQFMQSTDNTQQLAAWTYKNARKHGLPRRVAGRMAEDVWFTANSQAGAL